MHYILKVNIRPRVDGKPVFIEKGTAVSEEMIDTGTLKELIRQGLAEAVESPEGTEEESAEETEGSKAENSEHEQGVWNWKAEELEDYDLAVLSVMYKQRAESNGLEVREYTTKKGIIKKMTSEG